MPKTSAYFINSIVMNCYYCGVELTNANRTQEHIILKALGGTFTSDELLCREHNNLLGSSIDNELFNQLKFASVYLGFSEKNHIKMQTLDGEEIIVGGRLEPFNRGTIFIPNSNKEHFVWKKDANDIKKVLSKNLSQVEKKHPGISLRMEEYKQINKNKVFYIIQENAKVPGLIGFGGDQYFRAIVKMCIGFACFHKISNEYLIKAIAMIKGNSDIPADFFYPTTYSVRNKSNEEISHLLYLKGDPENKLLYVYSELFSFCNHICILSNSYEGEKVEKLYHFDLLNKVEMKGTMLNIRLNKNFTTDSKAILKSMFNNNQREQGYAFNNIIKLFEKLQLTENAKV